MLAQVSERWVAIIRWALVLAWLGILGLCLADPGLSDITDARSAWALPGWAGGSMELRGQVHSAQPYNPGPRLFWGVAIPCVILLLVVAGHETWRRICPMSALAQIPRKLGLQRRGGRVSGNGWWARNALLIQFSLLLLGVALRLTVLSAYPLALALCTGAVFVFALAIGVLYGGKTWCHFVCPVHVVQLVVNGPRGLGGSLAADGVGGLSQSMCRTSAKQGDVPACVGCNTPCPDVDLERHYWDSLGNWQRRVVVYGYLGLVLGLLAVIALAAPSGYGSAIWWDRDWQAPGWQWGNTLYPWPRWITTPVTLMTAVFGCVAAGVLIERVLGASETRRHRLMTLTTASALLLLILKGALPGLSWLGSAATQVLTVLSIAVVAMWTYRTWLQSAQAYQRNALAGSIRKRLATLPIDLSQHLKGRDIQQLSNDEVHVLSEVVPQLERGHRQRFYQQVLRDALASEAISFSGQADRARQHESLALLSRLRERLGVSEAEHRSLLAQCQQTHIVGDSTQQLRLASYRQQLEQLILQAVEAGTPLAQALTAQHTYVVALRQTYGIRDSEEEQIVAQLGASDGLLHQALRALVQQLTHIAWMQAQCDATRLSERYLRAHLRQEAAAVMAQTLGTLEALGEALQDPAGQARALVQADYSGLCAALADTQAAWPERLPPELVTALSALDEPASAAAPSSVSELEQVLGELFHSEDTLLAVVACRVAYERGLSPAPAWRKQLEANVRDSNLVAMIRQLGASAPTRLSLQLHIPGQDARFVDQPVRIGRSKRCEVQLPDARREHCVVGKNGDGVWIEDCGGLGGTWVNDRCVRAERVYVQADCLLRLSPAAAPLRLTLQREAQSEDDDLLSRFLWLADIPLFASLDRRDLLAFSAQATVQDIPAQQRVLTRGQHLRLVLVVFSGCAEAQVEGRTVGVIQAGETIGELSLLTGSPTSADVVAREALRVLTWPSERFREVLDRRMGVAQQLLRLIGQRLVDSLQQASHA